MATESNTKETKIVRATPKKTDSQQEEQPRVTVKAAVKPQVRTQTKQAQDQTGVSGEVRSETAHGETCS